jgi:thioredoxin 1
MDNQTQTATHMSNVTEIKNEQFAAEVLQAQTAVLVDFYAPWCGPCRAMAPTLDALAAEFAGRLKFVKVNVDDAQELAMQHNITGVPTLIVFQNGKPADQIVGAVSTRALRAKLEPFAAPAPAP